MYSLSPKARFSSSIGNGLFHSASLDLPFAKTKTLIDAKTGSNLITFTRASSGTFVGSNGVLQTAANDVPRFDHNPTTGESLGLLVEEQRTNSIRNNTMVGAVAGTPGTNPTNWTITSSATGLTKEIVGTGTESGIAYIDIKYSGTSTSAGSLQFSPDTTTGVPALTGQTWTGSSYVRLVGGTLPGAAAWVWLERDSGGAIVVSGSGGSVSVTQDALNSQRRTTTRTLSGGATVANLSLRIDVTVPNTTAVDVTLRIGLPQLEQGAFATSVIPTSGTAATRNADVASITGTNFSSWYRQDEGTVFAETQLPAGSAVNTSSRSIIDATDGSTNNRVSLRAIASGATVDQLTIRSSAATTAQFGSNGTAVSATARKIAAVYKLDDYAMWATGATSAAIDTSGAIPVGVNQITVGSAVGSSEFMSGTIRRLTYWPARLANSTLQAITQ